MERSKVDVNVTPDKRKVFMEREKLILAIVKSSLLQVYVDNSRDVPSMFHGTIYSQATMFGSSSQLGEFV